MTVDLRAPAITSTVLHTLGGPITSALRSKNFLAAEAHIRELLTQVNHESAWCFDTDPHLPHIAAYLATLHDTCARVRREREDLKKRLTDDLIKTIESLLNTMSHHMKNLIEEDAPDKYPSIRDVGLRGRRYEDIELAPPSVQACD